MKHFCFATVIGLLLTSVSSFAHAQKQGRVITLNEVTIVGRVQRPIAAVDVARIRPKITLSELRQPFLNKIEEAITKEPF
ncbi:MAG TPA: hypothetical protein PLJ27_23250 [Polyangiaceae bacterium]|jgi:hypothetical protein|nr:MAG: hypothetical protein BWY17_01938 [Deltaproteobacteria bacterium ADurb.Bin207]HNS97573.1 hypothetical protein [Polyangiaceae bacterium]HNZ21763.1 hypothetical protein [Polyangiaceae bacterium]HOD25045.1 hypothetical protein [Polyangiaceae bacterium]HOE50784.1 hypothetical protein [Polyangiaceae bacterium]